VEPPLPAPLATEGGTVDTEWPQPPASPGPEGPDGTPEAPAPPVPGAPHRAVVSERAPVLPSRRSTQAERDGVRALLGPAWDGHSAAVTRAMTRVPALRGGSSAESEDAAADLAVLHAYLTAAPEAPWSYEAMRAAESRAGGRALEPVLACVASALRRLPSYRGAVVRPAGGIGLTEVAQLLLPGEELGDSLPISGLAVERGGPAVAGDRYLVWSMTGSRSGSLLGQAGADGTDPADEVLFAPGTRLRLLAVDQAAGATVVLLRELAETAPAAVPGALDAADEAVLDRLRARGLTDETSAGRPAPAGLPGRCAGVLGLLATDALPGSG
jgi:hypothetical protein